MFDGNSNGEIHLGMGQYARILPGQARIYARKSYGRGDGSSRSIADQVACGITMCKQMGIPIDAETDVRDEPVGYSGGSYWEGGGKTNIVGDEKHKESKPRPVLTRLCKEIASGQVKVLMVWSIDRLARSVALMGSFVDLLNRHGVFLLDRNGLVPIHTPEGRQMVNTNMAMAQHYREMCKVNVERALQRKRDNGELATTIGALGFRSDGKGGVRALPEELAMVNRMFTMFDVGEGDGPMTIQQIALKLTEEGYNWRPDSWKIGGEERKTMSKKVYSTYVRATLTNLKYQAKQEYDGVIYDAKELLVNGAPAVDPALFRRVNARLRRNGGRSPRRSINSYPLSSLVRCGVCSRRFSVHPSRWETKEGIHRELVWRFKKEGSFLNCEHDLVGIKVWVLDEYVKTTLAPLLLAERQEQHRVLKGSALASRIAELRLHLDELRHKQATELPRLMRGAWMSNPKLVAEMHELIDGDIAKTENEIVRLQIQETAVEDELAKLKNLAEMAEAEYRETARAVLRWVAIVPADLNGNRGLKRTGRHQPFHQGKLLFCTAWGTYFTAVIEWRGTRPKSWQPFNLLRPAEPGEVFGGVADLPQPEDFFNNLRREQIGRAQPFDPHAWCPGYQVQNSTIEEFVAEFKLEGDASTSSTHTHPT